MTERLEKQEACQLFLEQEIEQGLEEGKTPYTIGKDLSVWIEKLFKTTVNPSTIERRARRYKEKIRTSVRNDTTIENDSEKQNNQDEEVIVEDMSYVTEPGHGGEREGAGRPDKNVEKKESGNLILLKSYWKSSTKTDKKRFIEWTKREGEK